MKFPLKVLQTGKTSDVRQLIASCRQGHVLEEGRPFPNVFSQSDKKFELSK